MGLDTVFAGANLIALLSWIALIFLPRWPALLSALLFLIVGGLCLTYAVAMIGTLSGLIDMGGGGNGSVSFTSIEGVRNLFASDGGVTIGWVHYLAFDLFVGIWIARDADSKGFSRIVQAPILLPTFMFGPIGLLIWLVVREGKARKLGRWT
ncbi:MAG: ABA4-like family protein [Marinomonas sp.]